MLKDRFVEVVKQYVEYENYKMDYVVAVVIKAEAFVFDSMYMNQIDL